MPSIIPENYQQSIGGRSADNDNYIYLYIYINNIDKYILIILIYYYFLYFKKNCYENRYLSLNY